MTLRQSIVQRLQELVDAGTWIEQPSRVAGLPSFRWTREEVTPAWAREGARPSWPGETYDRHIFLTFVGKSIIMRVCVCPWVRAQDSTPPLWLIAAILHDPELAFDTERRLAMQAARKASRGVSE